MHSMELCKKYLTALNKGDRETILALFAPGATVMSPAYGVVDARTYYDRFFADTDTSRAIGRLLNVFEVSADRSRIGLHMHYTWVGRDGRTSELECVNIYELTPDRSQFTKVTNIYDATSVQSPCLVRRNAGFPT